MKKNYNVAKCQLTQIGNGVFPHQLNPSYIGVRLSKLMIIAAFLGLFCSVSLYAQAKRVAPDESFRPNETQRVGIVPSDLTTQTPLQLVQRIVGSGVSVSNVTYTGAQQASGSFTGGTGIIGFEEGVVLSTGNIQNAVGPNNSSSAGTSNGLAGDTALTTIAGANTFDASVLQFDFVPTNNVVSFQFVFSSEEYNEFANSDYNDVFAFFVNNTNIALLPGSTTPIAINRVNGGRPLGTNPQNPQYYRNNDFQNGTAPINTQFDGLTVVFSVQANVTPNAVNRIRLAIADTSDSIYDSAVFIQGNSFTSSPAPHKFDFDGDNRDDLTVFRPSSQASPWYFLRSSNNVLGSIPWGVSTDRLVPADYDNDKKTDVAIFRNGLWAVLLTSNNTIVYQQFGTTGDTPAPADYDGDGKADFAYYRTTGGITGYSIRQSSNNVVRTENFGLLGDVQIQGDWDGDGKADPCVYRAAATSGGQGFFYYRGSLNNPSNNFTSVAWGSFGDRQVAADYDGDGKFDPAVFRPSGIWYIRVTANGNILFRQFGLSTDTLVPADYDGDNKTDVGVFRNGNWFYQRSSDGQIVSQQWGLGTDTAVESVYTP